MTDEDAMRLAIGQARQGVAAGQSPFGALIARDGRALAAAHNTVWLTGDPTAHAEVNAIRLAAHTLGTIDLSDCVIYSTCEPCPMCLGAIHWSKIGRVVYGAAIADAAAAGFLELRVPAGRLAAMGGSSMEISGGVLEAECRALFDLWRSTHASLPY